MERDHDSGDNDLPSADIEIPDDARELDREVQAYYRELRWQRRYARWHRVFGFAQRYGAPVPLFVSVLLVALLGAVSLVFSARPDGSGTAPQPGRAPGEGPSGVVGAPLIDVPVSVDGKPAHLSQIHPAVLVLVPPDCACRDALTSVHNVARRHGLPVYLVESGSSAPELERSADQLARGRSGDPADAPNSGNSGATPAATTVAVIAEPPGKIARTYGRSGLTGILVDSDAHVSTILDKGALATGANLESHLEELRDSWSSPGRAGQLHASRTPGS